MLWRGVLVASVTAGFACAAGSEGSAPAAVADGPMAAQDGSAGSPADASAVPAAPDAAAGPDGRGVDSPAGDVPLADASTPGVDAPGALVCRKDEQRWTGNLGGMPITFAAEGEVVSVTAKPWLLFGLADRGQFLVMRGSDQSTRPPIVGFDNDALLPFHGLLAMARTSGFDVYCLGSGAAFTSNRTAMATVDRAALVGACPGAPAQGELELCTSATAICRDLKGTLDGHPIDLVGFSVGGTRASHEFMAYDSALALRFTSSATEPVSNGLLWTPDDGPFAGAIYCIGSGTYSATPVEGRPESLHRFTLRQFTKLGACIKGAGARADMRGCVRGFY